MDRRRIELQIDAVLVPFRREQTRQAHSTMDEFRARAHSILDGLEEDARRHPDLEARLAEARRNSTPSRHSSGIVAMQSRRSHEPGSVVTSTTRLRCRTTDAPGVQ